jgi:hypothetical protein
MPLFEKATSFASSKLWDLLSQLYEKEAINSWQQVGVPFYLTSTPKLAYQWAQIALSFFLEIRQTYPEYGSQAQPWMIVEAGSGAGRFAYLFLKTFEKLLKENPQHRDIHWKYLMLDISAPVVDSWRCHPDLASFWEKGHLLAARFDLMSSQPIHLSHGEKLQEGFFKYPCAFLAGYLFDTLPAHAFSLEPGYTASLGIEVHAPQLPQEVGTVEFLNQMQYSFFESAEAEKELQVYVQAKQLEEAVDNLKQVYESNLELGQSWTLSTGALDCLEWMGKMSPQGFLSLSADQGMSDLSLLKDYPRIVLGRHGSISCPVNYHGLGHVLEFLGHKAILSRYGSHKFITMAAFIGGAKALETTPKMAQRLFDEFDNVNYWALVNQLLQAPSLDLELMELTLKIGQWDPINFFHLMPAWKTLIAGARDFQKERWKHFLREIHTNFFPISKEEGVLLNELGVCLSLLADWPSAKEVWLRASKYHSELAAIWLNLAIACMHEEDEAQAHRYFFKAQALSPELTDKLPMG